MMVVVEYLESSMARELLCKFPDNSSFDFDYSQSSIWSPLVPRAYPSLRDEGQLDNKSTISLKRVRSNIKKRIKFTVNDGRNYRTMTPLKSKKKNNKNNTCGFSLNYHSSAPSMSTIPTPRKAKGWSKMLKAASKHFKKTTKKQAHTSLVDLSNYPADGSF